MKVITRLNTTTEKLIVNGKVTEDRILEEATHTIVECNNRELFLLKGSLAAEGFKPKTEEDSKRDYHIDFVNNTHRVILFDYLDNHDKMLEMVYSDFGIGD